MSAHSPASLLSVSVVHFPEILWESFWKFWEIGMHGCSRPLSVSCFSKIQIGFTFLVPAHPGSPGQRAIKLSRVCVYVSVCMYDSRKRTMHRVVSFVEF